MPWAQLQLPDSQPDESFGEGFYFGVSKGPERGTFTIEGWDSPPGRIDFGDLSPGGIFLGSIEERETLRRQREQLIAEALETPEGRQALASAMVEPIRRAIGYQAIGRKLLMVDELPQGAYASYEKDVTVVAEVVQ